MSEVTKKSDTSSNQMRLLGGTPHINNHNVYASLSNTFVNIDINNCHKIFFVTFYYVFDFCPKFEVWTFIIHIMIDFKAVWFVPFCKF